MYKSELYLNDLEKYFFNNKNKRIHKESNYFEIYDRHFSKFRGKDINVIEIGVGSGESARMWLDYFGPYATIHGVDINPDCLNAQADRINIHIGDQADTSFLQSVVSSIPFIDVVIDDGGHQMVQQITTFETLFPKIQANGIYLCEDLHTSYWSKKYEGGYKKPNTFVEYSKDLIDCLNAWWSETSELIVTDFTKSTYALHYYTSVLVIEKRSVTKPNSLVSESGFVRELR